MTVDYLNLMSVRVKPLSLPQHSLSTTPTKQTHCIKTSQEYPVIEPTPKYKPPFMPSAPIKQKKELARPSELIRNRGIDTVCKKLEYNEAFNIHKLSSQIGNIRRDNAPKSEYGLGSCVLVAKNMVLTAKHCIKPTDMTVTFTDFTHPNQPAYKFKVDCVIPFNDEKAKNLELPLDAYSDLILLRLEPSATNVQAGNILGFAPIAKQCQKDAKELTFLGYTSANAQLKLSRSEIRPYDLAHAVSRKWLIPGSMVSWNQRKQGGIIERIFERDGKTLIKVRSLDGRSPKGVEHTLRVSKDGTVDKLRKTSISTLHDALVEPGVLYGTDHVVMTHSTAEGSSGGAYFNEQGELYAIHIGLFENNLFKGSDSQGFNHHIAFFPWAKHTTRFYEPYIKKETRFAFSDLSSISEKHASVFKNLELKISGASYGKVTRVTVSSKATDTKPGTIEVGMSGSENTLKFKTDLSSIKFGADRLSKTDIVIESQQLMEESPRSTSHLYNVTKSGIDEQSNESAKTVLRRFEEYIEVVHPNISVFQGDTHHEILQRIPATSESPGYPALKAHLTNVKIKRAKKADKTSSAIKIYLDPENGKQSKERAVYVIDGGTQSVSYHGRQDH